MNENYLNGRYEICGEVRIRADLFWKEFIPNYKEEVLIRLRKRGQDKSLLDSVVFAGGSCSKKGYSGFHVFSQLDSIEAVRSASKRMQKKYCIK